MAGAALCALSQGDLVESRAGTRLGIHAFHPAHSASARTADVSIDAGRHRARHRSASPLIPPEWLRDVERSLGVTRAHWTSVGHSDWADRYAVATDDERFFVKASSDGHASMLDAEADGLRALRSTNAIRVPQVVAQLRVGGVSILVLEGLEFARARDDAALGRALAGLHRAT